MFGHHKSRCKKKLTELDKLYDEKLGESKLEEDEEIEEN
jgi:hypothetical protein